jgi:hypothetical protein
MENTTAQNRPGKLKGVYGKHHLRILQVDCGRTYVY